LQSCRLCERDCRVNRLAGEFGACGCDGRAFAYWEEVLWGEEACITPSYALCFAGCNMQCAFCYAAESNSNPAAYRRVDPAAVAARVRACPTELASFSFIGGEPTVHLPTALQIMEGLPAALPIVWNSNFYFSEICASFLAGKVNTYIADLHFGNNACAREIAGAANYLEVVCRNLHWAKQAGTLIIRHLVLPGHLDCCTQPALSRLAAEFSDVPIHLMTNYLPPEMKRADRLAQTLSEAEIQAAQELLHRYGLRPIQ
jgi:putative pyruvate formate lyase activating enzyme